MKVIRFAYVSYLFFTALSISVHAQLFPTVKKFVAPAYPPAAIAVRAEGGVTVLAEVNSDGKVISARPVAGHKLLLPAARAIAEQWEFTAVPGSHFIILTFVFRLPSPRVKEFARLRGAYTLEFASPYIRVIAN